MRETELNLGQTLGNVYEESKLRAEAIVRDADCFDVLTIYRPASIIGDSRTGYTTSYHGFYLPLQLAYSFAAAIPPSLMNERFSSRLGLTGTEGKNFVPVDWVSAAITHIVSHPECHGRTYHLASPKPVSVRLFQSVIQEAIERHSGRPSPSQVDEKELALYERLFHDQMLIYRSHWRDDPQFDLTWSSQALGHLPCPEMDHDLLLRVARYPVENRFSLPRYAPSAVDVHVQQYLERFLRQPGGDAEGTEVAIAIDGPGGGQWHLVTRGRTILGAGDWGWASVRQPGSISAPRRSPPWCEASARSNSRSLPGEWSFMVARPHRATWPTFFSKWSRPPDGIRRGRT